MILNVDEEIEYPCASKLFHEPAGCSVLTELSGSVNRYVYRRPESTFVPILAGVLLSYAAKTKNNDLGVNSKLTRAGVQLMRDIEIPERVTIVTDLAKTHLADLAAYGVTEAQITDLATSVDDFRELIEQPRLVISQSNLLNKSAKELLDNVMNILNDELDPVMLQFELSNPDFYEGYKKASVIVD